MKIYELSKFAYTKQIAFSKRKTVHNEYNVKNDKSTVFTIQRGCGEAKTVIRISLWI